MYLYTALFARSLQDASSRVISTASRNLGGPVPRGSVVKGTVPGVNQRARAGRKADGRPGLLDSNILYAL
jgi:hypothetical protein